MLLSFLGNRTVLVVEPSSNYRTSIKQFLANLKVKNVKLVSSVAEARREMLTTKVGLFIVEWGLDETNGLRFCRSLRKEAAHKDVPFLLLSVENLRKDVILASEVRIDGYLLKPFSYEDFCDKIFGLLKAITQPTVLNNLLDLAEERLARGEIADAAKLFEESLGVRETSARALCGMARGARARDQAEEAMRLLREATRWNPEYVEAYRVMLEIAEEQDDRAGMVQTASILHALSPENPRYTLILARTYLEMEQLEGSERFFKKTIALSPRMAEAYKGLGSVNMAQEEYEKAMRNFKKALDLDADDISTLNSLGLAYVRLGQYKEGIDRYMVALKLDPHDARVLFNIGHAYEKRGDFERAQWYYAQALIHKPGFDKAARGVERAERLAREVRAAGGAPAARESIAALAGDEFETEVDGAKDDEDGESGALKKHG
jgi:tetratricopeptide (TPR) repeat protein